MKPSLWGLIAGLLFAAGVARAEDFFEQHPEAISLGKIAIIIDDLGYRQKEADALVALPHRLTLAIIPNTPHAKSVAAKARRNNKEIMIHAPMEPLHWRRWEEGFSTAMDKAELETHLQNLLDLIPEAVGLNNHGGSKFTQDKKRMDWLMASLANRGLYFVDSRTVASSVAERSAAKHQIPFTARDVFIDNDRDPAKIRAQLAKLQQIAVEEGEAVAIGHPHPETIAEIVEILPKFYSAGIHLVNASALTKPVNKKKLVKSTTSKRYLTPKNG